ncbi:ClbS/DfsB family four-helix bundle protein [Campylobacter concisus]|uniref:ClbS/DfsB family four-helix bundle protein n=1 Tax=Campylobacter concisus TaxID=199 RepID=UPI0021CCAABC|nr:ClbS/DfsB family four-helix bundle protein [Campylobacter concisus]
MGLVKKFTNEELFSKNVYRWVRSKTLGSYFVSAAPSHYDWATKSLRLIKKLQVKIAEIG